MRLWAGFRPYHTHIRSAFLSHIPNQICGHSHTTLTHPTHTLLFLHLPFPDPDLFRRLPRRAHPRAETPLGTPAEKWAQSMGFTEIVELLKNADAIRAEG